MKMYISIIYIVLTILKQSNIY